MAKKHLECCRLHRPSLVLNHLLALHWPVGLALMLAVAARVKVSMFVEARYRSPMSVQAQAVVPEPLKLVLAICVLRPVG